MGNKEVTVFGCVMIAGLFSTALVQAESESAEQVSVTCWGCMSVEVNIGSTNFVFDPYIQPVEPRFDYIFCSHDHYDHCHEDTLRQLTHPSSEKFKMLFASRGCFYASRLESPNTWGPTMLNDLNFVPRDFHFYIQKINAFHILCLISFSLMYCTHRKI